MRSARGLAPGSLAGQRTRARSPQARRCLSPVTSSLGQEKFVEQAAAERSQRAMLTAEELKCLAGAGIGLTAAVDAEGNLHAVGGLWEKFGPETIDLARRGQLRLIVVAAEQDDTDLAPLYQVPDLLHVIKATDVADAVRQVREQALPRQAVRRREHAACQWLERLDTRVPLATHYQVLPLLREVTREELERLPGFGDSDGAAERGVRSFELHQWE